VTLATTAGPCAIGDPVVGVDLGGTKVAAATLCGARLSTPLIERTITTSTDALVDQLVGAVRSQGEYAAVGIAVPSVVDFSRGVVRSSVNVPLHGVALRDILMECLEVPVVVDNDATAAAMAEAHNAGGALVASVMVMVTVGTGVGGGVVSSGRVFRGATGAAGEIGHMIVGGELAAGAPAHEPAFPQPDSLEAAAAGSRLDRLARERGLPTGPALIDAARTGDERAREVVALVGARLGVGIANLINIFDPDLVVIGGGVSAAGELLLAPARETAARFVVPGAGTQARIELARHGASAGVRGAALLARDALSDHRDHPSGAVHLAAPSAYGQ